MATSYSPQIVRDDLVLYYDASNTQKSWKGATADNRVITTPLALGVYAYVTGPVDTVVTDSTFQNRTVSRYTISQAVNTARARIAPATSSLALSTPYAFSCIWKYNGTNTASPTFVIDASKGNPEGSNNSFSSVVQTNTSLGNGWTYSKYEFTLSVSSTLGSILTFGILTGTDSTYINNTFDVYNVQFEQNTYATPYVAGSRSTTQAVLDLSNNNTLTAALTYASDNTFSFNGTSNAITVPFNSSKFTFNLGQTIIIWMKNSSPSSARRNPYNQAYGGAGTITHENDTNFNYYYGTSGVNNTPYTSHTSPFSVVVGETAMICITRNTSITAWYKNGILGNTQSNPYTTNVLTGTADILIGAGYAGYFGGNIYSVMVYNRALTASEVFQNFSALRGRYNL